MFHVYVIRSSDSLYIGFTNDLKRRVNEHNAGKSPYTKRKSNWKLLYYEAHSNKNDAMRREKYLKTSGGAISLKKMLREALHVVE